MVELVVSVCSILYGAQCHDVSLTYADMPMLACLMSGQPEIAKWSEVNPNWSIRRWTCRPAGLFAKI